MALATGGRCNESANLTCDQVDLSNSTINFLGNGAKERLIPISDTLFKYLNNIKNKESYVISVAHTVNAISRQF
jgi:site-specific recombinase XerD